MLRLPFPEVRFGTVIAWGILSVTGDFERALELAWSWLSPGGHCSSPSHCSSRRSSIRSSAATSRSSAGSINERTRRRDVGAPRDRYPVNDRRFYSERLAALPCATLVESGGVSMLPSLVLGGVAQDVAVDDAEKAIAGRAPELPGARRAHALAAGVLAGAEGVSRAIDGRGPDRCRARRRAGHHPRASSRFGPSRARGRRRRRSRARRALPVRCLPHGAAAERSRATSRRSSGSRRPRART